MSCRAKWEMLSSETQEEIRRKVSENHAATCAQTHVPRGRDAYACGCAALWNSLVDSAAFHAGWGDGTSDPESLEPSPIRTAEAVVEAARGWDATVPAFDRLSLACEAHVAAMRAAIRSAQGGAK